MKNMFNRIYAQIRTFMRNHPWWSIIIALACILVLVIFLGRKKNTPDELVAVAKHNLVEEVSATGNVKPLSDLDLSFRSGGQVASIPVAVGDSVYAGESLASLLNGDLVAAVKQAKAGLAIALAKLVDMQNGTRPEELAIAANTLANSITSAYTTSDDAIRNDIDQMFTNPTGVSPQVVFSVNNFQLKTDINNARMTIEGLLHAWKQNPATSTAAALASVDTIQGFLDNLALALSTASSDTTTTQTTLATYKASVSGARLALAAARSSITSAQANYDLDRAGNTPASINAQEAAVEEAQANVDAAQAELAKSVIVSPIAGVVTNIVPSVGQTLAAGAPAISVISYGRYDVESFVPEADIAKVAIGDMATTTLDAYGSETFFFASVVKIDPAETVIEGVPTYKVTLAFATSSDARIRSGMTANLSIRTDQKQGVLAVPSRSVYTLDNIKYVDRVDPANKKATIRTEVTTGIRGEDGYVEIRSGLKEGDTIKATPAV